MELFKGGSLDYKDGALLLQIKVAGFILPKLDEIQKKVESGEIDLIKGTDLDKMAVLQVLAAIKAELSK